ncbi:hypothetical protein [Roseibium sp. SCP14]|uniref:hypothetical protein n=1 Tax=Roseibium sp. SCP14 TaxID=3141375 RepID=UPI00333A79DE
MKGLIGASWAGSITAVGVASCCILPVTMMLLGLGGSWLAIFGIIAAASYYVLAVSVLLLLIAWVSAARLGSLGKFKWWLGSSTMLTLAAWAIVSNEARLNEFLIGLM